MVLYVQKQEGQAGYSSESSTPFSISEAPVIAYMDFLPALSFSLPGLGLTGLAYHESIGMLLNLLQKSASLSVFCQK